MTCETDAKTPPMEWYEGIAFPGEGIRMVAIGTRAFFALHPDLYGQMAAWLQTRAKKGQPDCRSSEEIQIHYKVIGNFIQKVTDFAPEDLIEYSSKLERIYVGQSMGPFPFPVTWITK